MSAENPRPLTPCPPLFDPPGQPVMKAPTEERQTSSLPQTARPAVSRLSSCSRRSSVSLACGSSRHHPIPVQATQRLFSRNLFPASTPVSRTQRRCRTMTCQYCRRYCRMFIERLRYKNCDFCSGSNARESNRLQPKVRSDLVSSSVTVLSAVRISAFFVSIAVFGYDGCLP